MEADDRENIRIATAGAMLHAIICNRGVLAGEEPRKLAVSEAFKLADEFMRQAEATHAP